MQLGLETPFRATRFGLSRWVYPLWNVVWTHSSAHDNCAKSSSTCLDSLVSLPPSSKAQPSSFEDRVIRWLGNVLPIFVLRWLPTVYYRINRYRFRILRRPAMAKETAKAKTRRHAEGFFDKYFQGAGIDIGYGGDLVVPNCRGWDVEDGDAHELRGIADKSLDFAYSSHVLEHLENPVGALRNWWRVLKPGGYLILYLPERDLFERKRTLPSDISLDHKHYFLLDRDDPPDTIGLVPLVKNNLPGAEIVYKKVCSAGFDPNRRASFMADDVEYSIELVARKSK
jgi:SAM-dependent methyltransferase